jgi:DNA replication protein DnaC
MAKKPNSLHGQVSTSGQLSVNVGGCLSFGGQVSFKVIWGPAHTRTVKDVISSYACPVCCDAGYLRQSVPVEHPDFGRPILCDCRRQRQNRARQQQSQLEGWLRQATFANYKVTDFNRAAFEAARKFAQNPRGWLTLSGNFGPGKTHLLAAVVNDCRQRDLLAAYYTLPDLLDKLRPSFGQNDYSSFFEYLRTIRVLALDEIDKARLTEWAQEKIYQLFDARYRRLDELGTLLALNQEPADSLPGYLFSRMFDERNQVIQLTGPDARPMSDTLWSSFSDPEART